MGKRCGRFRRIDIHAADRIALRLGSCHRLPESADAHHLRLVRHASGAVARGQIFLRIGLEFLGAALAAEVIELVFVLNARRGIRGIDVHAADWIAIDLAAGADLDGGFAGHASGLV